MSTGVSYRYHTAFILAICLAGAVIYSNTLNSPFVFDDIINIEENRYIRMEHLDAASLFKAGFESHCRRRPVANMSIALNDYFGQQDVTGYHMVNIIIHLINGVLVYILSLLILRQMAPALSRLPDAGNRLAPFFIALFFVAHPLQTESVTYIIQRMTSMAVMFYLAAFILYIRGRLAPGGWRRNALFLGCLACWIMALGSKEIAAMLPVTLLVYEWYFFQDLSPAWLRRNLLITAGAGGVLLVIVLIYFKGDVAGTIVGGYANREFTMLERVLTQFRVVCFYISLMVFPLPSRMNLNHGFTTSASLIDPLTTLLSAAAIAGLFILAIFYAKRHRLISFCILWFFIHMVMESSIIGLEMIFEHRLYLPMFGVVLGAVYLLFRSWAHRPARAVAAGLVIVMLLGTATYVRNLAWKNKITLWTDVVSKNPGSARARYNLGNALRDRERFEDAIVHYTAAVTISPGFARAHNNLGIALSRRGRFEEADRYYREAIRLQSEYAAAHYNFGLALASRKRYDEAAAHYAEAIRISPLYAKAHNNMGAALFRLGKMDGAVAHYAEALRIRPDYAMAHNNLGYARMAQGDLEAAADRFSRAIAISPGYARAHYNLGNALFKLDRLEAAEKSYTRALRIKPDYAEARRNLEFVRQQLEKMQHNSGQND